VALQARQQARDNARSTFFSAPADGSDPGTSSGSGDTEQSQQQQSGASSLNVGGYSEVDVLTMDELFQGDFFTNQHAALSARAGGHVLGDGDPDSELSQQQQQRQQQVAVGRAFVGPVAASDITSGSVGVQSRKEVMSLQDLVEALGQDPGAAVGAGAGSGAGAGAGSRQRQQQ